MCWRPDHSEVGRSSDAHRRDSKVSNTPKVSLTYDVINSTSAIYSTVESGFLLLISVSLPLIYATAKSPSHLLERESTRHGRMSSSEDSDNPRQTASIEDVPRNVLAHVVDVHCHPTDTDISSSDIEELPIRICAMATRKSDQALVAQLAHTHPDKVIPCFG